ncbi:aminotransferase class I/II-fold pyridoxal phosphate-dependent enzyme [Bacillus sp. TL12]|uniref:aminotransferase class I/II-fold pyridoxal phosphate-dependent enzyme n=1 Tax=Bacillus sp. TL12 TaxID=2894756 RepID=UPI001F52A32E|nr:aminotransferase class I/II-fold pyridoxal phosphate-dependent enzyme [Bacillus sp. TL12]MCI0768171.1 aminotransferase class I/II-fold pyridoxal phosphate-dependent enzyme [Bacillus sp. TL12]
MQLQEEIFLSKNKSKQYETPLITGVKNYINSDYLQMHTPGHIKGRGLDEEFTTYFGKNTLDFDLVGIPPLDYLRHPTGIIHEAQVLAADAFGADYTIFSVQGTSSANVVMIMSICNPGDKIIIPRNVHASIVSGLILSGAVPIFISPEVDSIYGVCHGISLENIKQTLEAHPDVKGVCVINPTYYGAVTDLKAIIDYVHSKGIPVIVDEAQGSHVHFHPDLPISAMEAGADIASSSMHKMGGSFTQTSVINVREGLVSLDRVKENFSLITTTSASYLLMASLDAARKQLAVNGEELLQRALNLSRIARGSINKIPGLSCLGPEDLKGLSSSFALDETKLCINVTNWGVTGREVENILRDDYRIEVELSDVNNILFIVTIGHNESDIEQLLQSLKSLAIRFENGSIPIDFDRVTKSKSAIRTLTPPTLAMTPREAYFSKVEYIDLDKTIGRVAAESVLVTPPGIPVLLPGEVITIDIVNYLKYCIELGLSVQSSNGLHAIKVIDNK